MQERARSSSAAASSPGAGRQGLGLRGQGQGLGIGTRSANNAEEEGQGPAGPTHTPRGSLASGMSGQHPTGNSPRHHSANSSSGSGNNSNSNSSSTKMSNPGSGGVSGSTGNEGGQGTGGNGGASGAPNTPIVSTAGALSPGSIAMWVDAEKVSRRVVIKSYQGDGYYRVHIGVGAATIDTHESKLTAVADLPVITHPPLYQSYIPSLIRRLPPPLILICTRCLVCTVPPAVIRLLLSLLLPSLIHLLSHYPLL